MALPLVYNGIYNINGIAPICNINDIYNINGIHNNLACPQARGSEVERAREREREREDKMSRQARKHNQTAQNNPHPESLQHQVVRRIQKPIGKVPPTHQTHTAHRLAPPTKKASPTPLGSEACECRHPLGPLTSPGRPSDGGSYFRPWGVLEIYSYSYVFISGQGAPPPPPPYGGSGVSRASGCPGSPAEPASRHHSCVRNAATIFREGPRSPKWAYGSSNKALKEPQQRPKKGPEGTQNGCGKLPRHKRDPTSPRRAPTSPKRTSRDALAC